MTETSPTSNGAAPPPPETPSDPHFFEPLESDGQSPQVKFLLIQVDQSDTRYFNRMGFYCALDTVEDPNRKFVELLAEQKARVAEQRAGMMGYYFAKEERYLVRIRENELKKDDEKIKLLAHLADLPEAKTAAEMAAADKFQLEKELSEKAVAFGKRKESLVADAIESVRKNLEDLLRNYQAVHDERLGINRRAFDANHAAFALKARQFERLREQTDVQWNRLVSKMERLRFDGVNPPLANWLFYLGLAVATVCGAYFFSIFALAKQMNDSNVTFFILEGFERFIGEFYPDRPMGQRFLMLGGWLFGLSFLVSVAAWWCWRLLAYLDTESKPAAQKADKTVQLEFSDERQLTFELQAKSSNFYQFWLQVAPIFVVLGLFLIIAFLGQGPGGAASVASGGHLSNLQKLDISLTGAAIGALLTLLVAGLSCLYILYVVEPRSERAGAENRSTLRQNIELIVASGLFLLSLTLLFFIEKNDFQNGGKQPGVIFQYAMLVVANGFLLGYALRLKGLFASLRFLERKVLALTNAIRDNSSPRPTSLASKEDRLFSKEYFRLQRELFNLALLKTQLGNQALGGQNAVFTRQSKQPKRPKPVPNPAPKPPDERGWRRFVYFWKKKPAPQTAEEIAEKEASPVSLQDWEARLYPADAAELEQLGKNLARARTRSREAEERVEAMKEDRSPFCIEIRARLQRLDDSINGLKIGREKALFQKSQDLRLLMQLGDTIQADIREGFNLGTWFRSEVGPDFRPPGGFGGSGNGAGPDLFDIIENGLPMAPDEEAELEAEETETAETPSKTIENEQSNDEQTPAEEPV